MVQKLPQFKSQYDNYAMHKQMLKLITKSYEESLLSEIAEQEQNMATNLCSDGTTPKNTLGTITSILRKKISNENKLRLIILYIITNGASNKDKLINLANLDTKEIQIIENLANLGISLEKRSLSSYFTSFYSKKTNQKTDVDYSLSRYVPKIKEICLDLMTEKLSEKEYCWIDKPDKDFKIESWGKEKKKDDKKKMNQIEKNQDLEKKLIQKFGIWIQVQLIKKRKKKQKIKNQI